MKFEDFIGEVSELRKLAEGWRGEIFTGVWRGEKISIKKAKEELLRESIRKEAHILSRLKGHKEFPQILLLGEDFFAYEYIEGVPYGESVLSEKEKKKVISELLRVAYKLDRMGINRDEFSRIDKNVLIGKGGRVYVLDFDRGSLSDRATNLTQFLQFLRREGFLTKEEAIDLGKKYTLNPGKVYRTLRARLK